MIDTLGACVFWVAIVAIALKVFKDCINPR